MSREAQNRKDAERLIYLRERINEDTRNADIAREAIQLAEKYRMKANYQRKMLAQIQRKGAQNNDE